MTTMVLLQVATVSLNNNNYHVYIKNYIIARTLKFNLSLSLWPAGTPKLDLSEDNQVTHI